MRKKGKKRKLKMRRRKTILKNAANLTGDTQNVISQSLAIVSLSKLPTRKERRNSILMTCHYTDLGSVSDWLKICWN